MLCEIPGREEDGHMKQLLLDDQCLVRMKLKDMKSIHQNIKVLDTVLGKANAVLKNLS